MASDRRFRFGAQLSFAGSGGEWATKARRVEELGYATLCVPDHFDDQLAPMPALVAAAAATSRLRVGTLVLDNDYRHPLLLAKEAATVDLLSGGRAEIMAGRGSFIESFPLFGYDLDDYDELFAEKLELLLTLRTGEHITWSGRHRAPIDGRGVYPRPVQDPLPVWVAVGGNPQSVVRAGVLGLPMALAIIGGLPERFQPFVELHRRAVAEAGHDPLPVSINSHGFVAETREQAIAQSFPYVSAQMNKIGRERGWPPMRRDDYEAAASLRGANFVGSPEDVVEKILFQHGIFGHDRFLVQFSVGTMPHDQVLRSIELFATQVAPAVRDALAS